MIFLYKRICNANLQKIEKWGKDRDYNRAKARARSKEESIFTNAYSCLLK